jgi:hypothetical protein
MLEMNTYFQLAKGSISRWFSEPSVSSEMKLWSCKVIPGPGDKPMIVVNFKGEEKQLAAEEISFMVLIKMEDAANNFCRGYYTVGKGIMLVANNFDDGLFYGSNELRSFIILPWDIVDHIQPRFFTAIFIDATSVDDAVVWFWSATNATHVVLLIDLLVCIPADKRRQLFLVLDELYLRWSVEWGCAKWWMALQTIAKLEIVRKMVSSACDGTPLDRETVFARKVEEQLQSLREGGVPPWFLIIDDGWQETVDRIKDVDEALHEQTIFAQRLADLKVNHKFRGGTCKNLVDLVKTIKEKQGVQCVYMSHTWILGRHLSNI